MTTQASQPFAAGQTGWTRRQITQDGSWLFELHREQADAVRDTLASHANLSLAGLTNRDFDFGPAEGVFARAAEEVDVGSGFAVVRGLDPSGLSVGQLSRGFYGIGTRFGTMRSQNARGDLVGQVMNEGFDFADPDSRGYMTRDELNPHSDGCDILALLCVRKARSGGENTIVSSLALHNAMLARFPELVEPLYRGFYYDLRNEQLPDGQSGVSSSRWPVFLRHEGVVSCGFNPKAIRNAPIKRGQRLEPIEEEAISTFERLSKGEEFSIGLTLEPGDLLFLNNLITLHARTAFEDSDVPDQKRLLLRLWITSHRPRPLPEEIARIVRGGFKAQASIIDAAP